VQNGKETSTGKLFRENCGGPRPYKTWLDSGVFTARQKGISISTDELIRYALDNKHVYDYVFTNDEGTHEQQYLNTKQMKDAGVNVLGIYHGDMPLSMLDKYIDLCDGYIAIGAWHNNMKFTPQYVDPLFNHIVKNYKSELPKVHFLGTESHEPLKRYPIYSSDASSFIRVVMHGNITVYNEKKVKVEMADKANPKHHAYFHTNPHFTASQLLQTDRDGRKFRLQQSVIARSQFAQTITRMWEKRGVVWQG